MYAICYVLFYGILWWFQGNFEVNCIHIERDGGRTMYPYDMVIGI